MKNSCVIWAASTAVIGLLTGGCAKDPSPDTSAASTQSVALTPNPSDPPTLTPRVTTPTPPVSDPVIASVNGRPITKSQLYQPLVEAYGLNMMLNLVQLELAKEAAEKAKLNITEADVVQEREYTTRKLLPDVKPEDMERTLAQFLENQRITPSDFTMTIRINTYLRRIVTPVIIQQITEPILQEAFGTMYGEQVQVRHIAVGSMQLAVAAKAKIAAGEPFQKIAKEMSENPRTAAVGGELPPFARNSTNIPAVFRDMAFSLKPGEVSDAVQDGTTYHLIKVERRVPPKAVKYEDVKQSVREDVEERLIQAGIAQLRTDFGRQAIATLSITEPTLLKQYEARIKERDSKIKDREEVKDGLTRDRERRQAEQRGATQPANGATVPGTTLPTTETTTSPFPPRGTVPDAPSTTGPTLFPREATPSTGAAPGTNAPADTRSPATTSAAPTPATADAPSSAPTPRP